MSNPQPRALPRAGAALRVNVLGPLEVFLDDTPVPVTGGRLRALLLRLAVEPSRPVSVAELASAVWGDELPADPANSLQSLVSRLRRALGDPSQIRQQPMGYQLQLDRHGLDAARFSDLVAAGRSLAQGQDLTAASARFTEALSLWRGPALVDGGAADYVTGYTARWNDLCLTARAELVDIALQQGRAAEVVTELEELVATHPLRERFTRQLMLALVATGRSAEALRRYEQLRRFLAEQLGTDPGAELQQLHLTLLRGAAPPPDPAVRTRARANLRAPVTSFVGRRADLDQVRKLLTTSRLTTIVGPGGAGKTRLAVEAARSWLTDHPDAAWLVELAPVTSGANIAPTILGAIGVLDVRLLDRVEGSRRSDLDRLVDALTESPCLLVIDNCEHLIEPVSRLVDEILGRVPQVRVLATSREPLAIAGEALCAIPPLTQPTAGSSLQEAAGTPAVRLWTDRAQAVQPGFELTEDNVAVVTEIVRRLDGLPLAIELAAARLRFLPVDEIAARLSDRFRLLTGGNRTALPRHRTLRAVVEWSWGLLTADERVLVERLSVFPAGTTVESAVSVCSDERLRPERVEELLISLVDKSLLETTLTSPVRYRMLETIREYGVERLTEREEIHAARTAHADHFAALAARLEPQLRTADQLAALATLNDERDNIVAALRYYGDSGRPAEALTLGLALVWYWSLRGRNSEAVAWMTFVLEANAGRDEPLLAYAEAARAVSQMTSADAGPDWEHLQEEFVAILRRLSLAGDPPFVGLLGLVPLMALFAGWSDEAPEALARSAESPHRWVRAATHAWSATAGENEGDLDRIRRESALAYAEFSAIGDRWGLSTVLTVRAHLATLEGDLDQAISDSVEALRYVTELGSTEDDLYLLLRLAGLHVRQGDTVAARRRLDELRARSAGMPWARERGLFADSLLAGLLWVEGRRDEAVAMSREMKRRVTDRERRSPLQGHAYSIILATAAVMAAGTGDSATGLDDVLAAYPVAVSTRDMPIIASVGVAVSHVAAALSRSREAAEILGAATQVRGSDDWTDPQVADLVGRLSEALGEEFAQCYAAGRQLGRDEAIRRLDPAPLAAVTTVR